MTELPEGWAYTTLGALGHYVNGRAFKPAEWRTSGRPIIRIQNLTGSSNTVNYFDGDVDPRYIVEPGDLLVSWSATLGSYFWSGSQGVLNQHIFRVDSHINRRFHKYLVDHVLSDLLAKTHGSGMVHITRKPFDSTPVLIPPLAEQERIVVGIEEQFSRIDAGVAALQGARRKLKRMRAAVLQAAVTGHLSPRVISEDVDETLTVIEADRRAIWAHQNTKPYKPPALAAKFPLEVPGHWRVTSLEALTDPVRVICYGILMPKENIAGGVPYVRVKDMKGWSIDVVGLKRTSRAIADSYARASLARGDLLLAIRGSYGRVARVPEELEGGNITQDTARIAAHPFVDRRYLLYYLGGSVANRYYQSVARGVAVKGVNIGDLRTMPVPVPPRAEQVAIADEVDRQFTLLDAMEYANEQQLRRTTSLRSSILSSAFSGRLVRQHPGDEAASVLLERIAADGTSRNGREKAAASTRRKARQKVRA